MLTVENGWWQDSETGHILGNERNKPRTRKADRERTGTISYARIWRALEWPGKTQNTSPTNPSIDKHDMNVWSNVSSLTFSDQRLQAVNWRMLEPSLLAGQASHHSQSQDSAWWRHHAELPPVARVESSRYSHWSNRANHKHYLSSREPRQTTRWVCLQTT